MIDTYLDYEKQSQEASFHREIFLDDIRREIEAGFDLPPPPPPPISDARAEMTKAGICPFTGRERAEIGQKPRGFDPVELPDFEAENEISQAIGDDTRQALHLMRLCGRGVSRSSAEIWADED